MKCCKLRIAWSVAWGVAAVLLVVMWARSYWWVDQVFVPITKSTNFVMASIPNAFGLGVADKNPAVTQKWIKNPTSEWITVGPLHDRSDFLTYYQLDFNVVAMPYWFGLLLSAGFASVPQIWGRKWRFSLRTLLIATTLVAVGLGVIIWVKMMAASLHKTSRY